MSTLKYRSLEFAVAYLSLDFSADNVVTLRVSLTCLFKRGGYGYTHGYKSIPVPVPVT